MNTLTPEDEAFNEIEKRSKVKQDILMHPSKEAMLAAEVAVLTEMVRVLSDKVNELEKQNGVPVGVGGWLTTTSKQEQGEPYHPPFRTFSKPFKDVAEKTIPAIKQEQGEPVAWMDVDGNVSDNNDHKCFPIPLYTASQQRTWVGLSDEEISDIAINNPPMVHELARAIEAKLKEKNT
jgi:hypothetical protein